MNELICASCGKAVEQAKAAVHSNKLFSGVYHTTCVPFVKGNLVVCTESGDLCSHPDCIAYISNMNGKPTPRRITAEHPGGIVEMTEEEMKFYKEYGRLPNWKQTTPRTITADQLQRWAQGHTLLGDARGNNATFAPLGELADRINEFFAAPQEGK